MEKISLFFEQIYSWFMDLPQGVSEVLYEITTTNEEEILLTSAYPTIGVTILVISVIIAFAFYIWPGNHPRFKAWWAWLLTMVVNACINFGVALAYLNHRVDSINADETLLQEMKGSVAYSGNIIELDTSGFIDFGVVSVCVSVLCFCFGSLLLNWFSSTCRFSPFRK